MVRVAVDVRPAPSVTVSFATYVPLAVYVWMTQLADERGVPSPKSHSKAPHRPRRQ
jgi:hypothetical protein